MKVKNLVDLKEISKAYKEKLDSYNLQITVCGGGGCVSSGCGEVHDAVSSFLTDNNLEDKIYLGMVGCMGLCSLGPLMYIQPGDILYVEVSPDKAIQIIESHISDGKILEEYTFIDEYTQKHIPKMHDIPYFSEQTKIALKNSGIVDYSSLDSYIAEGGFLALDKALKISQEEVIEELTLSGLRGRGGGGFPVGIKWSAGYKAPGDTKFIICNADEGDPGAFMDRSLIESDPFGLIEGMIIGGYAIGAEKGFVYVRAEYPIAVERLTKAIDITKESELLGDNILGSNFNFDIEVRIGAGAFVCGEETALMRSVEGERGEPSQKPPFPFESGLFGYPTIINNVETFANVPAIIMNGSGWFSSFGTEKSKGTKVFALAGDIRYAGLAEVPMGYSMGDMIYKIGGGIPRRGRFKAAQIGGPSGGCVTKEYLNTSLDFEALSSLGAIMGSGGLVVMGEDTCMVDTARFFMDFIRDESCGKCVPCRIGTKRMLEILEKFTKGEGSNEDIELLEELAENITQTAMCGLGQTSPNPVMSTLQFFKEEYEEHIKDYYCRAGVCSDMFTSPCQNACPAGVDIPGFIGLIGNGRLDDAYSLIRRENPFPGICGRICTRPCENKCHRIQRDEAISIANLERFVSDYAMNHQEAFTQDIKYPMKDKRVAIIGSGPSGLTCAYYLARMGYIVDVFEGQANPGGTMAFGIPENRLPEDVLDYEIQLIRQEGVNIHLNTEVGKNISFTHLREEFDAIYLSTGAKIPSESGIKGESLKGVYQGFSLLKDIKTQRRVRVGKKIIVIGGGSTAIDAARSCIRLGAKEVTVLYRRDIEDMTADPLSLSDGLEEGIEIKPLTIITEILADDKGRVKGVLCLEMQLEGYDKNGRPMPHEIQGSEFTIDCDMVIPAISRLEDLPPISKDIVEIEEWGNIELKNNSLFTSIEGVFAGGDVVRGPDTIIMAISDGKKAASKIDKYLGGNGKLNKGRPIDIPKAVADEDSAEYGRFPAEKLSADARIEGFREANRGYRKLFAVAEAARCTRCDGR